jgi:imidazolonepropionase-like amidohydrolase
MKSFKRLGFMLLAMALPAMAVPSAAYESAKSSSSATVQKASEVLIKNVRIFDGKNEKLADGMSVLVEGNKITKIGKSIPALADATVIEGGGRTLMPGLIDAHYHPVWAAMPLAEILVAQEGYINFVAGKNAEQLLLQGFTSVREAAGNSFGLKRAIDEGLIAGPRIYPAGPMISQTSGHGDFRPYTAVPSNPGEPLAYSNRNGHTVVADGVPEVMKRARESLRMGASHIKLAAGGGVASYFDPIDVREYTFEELKAAVDVAATWNTYVMVHAYTSDAVQTAIKAGVKSIDHGQMIDEATAKMMAEKGVWLSIQPFLDDEDAIPFPEGTESRKKQKKMVAGTEKAIQ